MARRRLSATARGLLAVASVIAAAVPFDAAAHPNTPVPMFGEVPCMTVVDKSTEPVVEFMYGIDEPIGEIPPDNTKLEDNHTLQFFALKRAFPGTTPNWIGDYDLDRVEALGIVDPAQLLPEHVLEWTPELQADEWERIVPDDARLPLTPVASATIAWDTSASDSGAYLVYGYSWEPPVNLWTPRFGAVRVLEDGSDPASGGPAVFLSVDLGATVTAGDDYLVRGCYDAAPGSELVLRWAARVPNAEWVWNEFGRLDVEAGELEVVLPTTADLAQQTLAIRADIVDPQGRSSLAMAPVGVDVRPAAPPTNPGEDSSDSGGESETGDDGSSTGLGDGSGSEDTGASGASNDDADGCSCSHKGRGSSGAYWLMVFAVWSLRRRRTSISARPRVRGPSARGTIQ